ncbi:MAG: hypothetical protein ACR2MW_08715 [Chthoniobacterales bacterium]
MQKRVSFLLLILALGVGPTSAGPIDFLKRVGRSIVHPHHVQPAPRKTKVTSRKTKPTTDPNEKIAVAPSTPGPAASVAPMVATVPTISPTPVRAANAVPTGKVSGADLPYGVPVAGRPGFVTSPYSPTGGYVDVRSFPRGSEVRDPYSGKVFRTP